MQGDNRDQLFRFGAGRGIRDLGAGTAPGDTVSEPAGFELGFPTSRIGVRRSAWPVWSGAVSICALWAFSREGYGTLWKGGFIRPVFGFIYDRPGRINPPFR